MDFVSITLKGSPGAVNGSVRMASKDIFKVLTVIRNPRPPSEISKSSGNPE